MNKLFIAMIFMMSIHHISSLDPLDQLKAIVEGDTCTVEKVEALKPQIRKAVDRLR